MKFYKNLRESTVNTVKGRLFYYSIYDVFNRSALYKQKACIRVLGKFSFDFPRQHFVSFFRVLFCSSVKLIVIALTRKKLCLLRKRKKHVVYCNLSIDDYIPCEAHAE